MNPKPQPNLWPLLRRWPALAFLIGLFLAVGCSSAGKNNPPEPPPTAGGKNVLSPMDDDWDDLDEFEAVLVHDPIEAFNRATFMMNHGIYTVVVRPVSETYKFIFPEVVRTSIHNAYENVRFPVRLVNHAFQGKFDRAGLETGRFLVDTTLGVGGIFKASDKFPALASVPRTDTGTTLAGYGLGHGPYLVIPVIGPSSSRDLFGLIGDAALNPVTWVSFMFGGAAWTIAISTPNTLRSIPDQMDTYDTVTRDAVDRYIAARTAYIQYRNARAGR